MTWASVNRVDARPHPGEERLLVLGGGYTGQRFGRTLAARGLAVTLTRRDPPVGGDGEGGSEGEPGCPRWVRFDPANAVVPAAEALAGTTHVLVTIPPDGEGGDPVLTHLADVLQTLPLRWVGYLSTTGVYGDRQGGWVDEGTPEAPGLERSRARLACENAWRRQGLPLQVFRLPAIYGPDRTPFRDLRQGTAQIGRAHV